MFRLLSLLAAFSILVLYESQAGRALAGQSANPADAQMTQADGTQRYTFIGPRASYPTWLLLPPGAHIINGFLSDNSPTQGGGMLGIAVGGDGQALFAAWEARLRAAGFTPWFDDDPTRCTFGILSSLNMEQPPTGRGLTLNLTPDGLELFFWEPYSGRP